MMTSSVTSPKCPRYSASRRWRSASSARARAAAAASWARLSASRLRSDCASSAARRSASSRAAIRSTASRAFMHSAVYLSSARFSAQRTIVASSRRGLSRKSVTGRGGGSGVQPAAMQAAAASSRNPLVCVTRFMPGPVAKYWRKPVDDNTRPRPCLRTASGTRCQPMAASSVTGPDEPWRRRGAGNCRQSATPEARRLR